MGETNDQENRRATDRRIDRFEQRQLALGEDVAVLKAGQRGLEEDIRRIAPVVLEQSELRSDIRDLAKGDQRLEAEVLALKAIVMDGEKARTEAREEAAEARERERLEAARQAQLDKASQRTNRWKTWSAIAVAFILSTGTIIAAVIASIPHGP